MKEKGSTVIELVTVMGIFSILFGFIAVNIFSAQEKVSIQNSLTTLAADVKQQQIKAMSLNTNGGLTAKDQGIYFSQNSYTLYSGSSYTQGESSNFTVLLSNNVVFSSILLPNQTLIFTKRTGEVSGYNANMHSVTLVNTQSNETKTIQVNKLGVLDVLQ